MSGVQVPPRPPKFILASVRLARGFAPRHRRAVLRGIATAFWNLLKATDPGFLPNQAEKKHIVSDLRRGVISGGKRL